MGEAPSLASSVVPNTQYPVPSQRADYCLSAGAPPGDDPVDITSVLRVDRLWLTLTHPGDGICPGVEFVLHDLGECQYTQYPLPEGGVSAP